MTYIPSINFVGVDNFTYTASDGKGGSDIASVSINVMSDQDSDSIPDVQDNCITVENLDQRDTNNDGYGNICDADLNNDGTTDKFDAKIFRASRRSTQGDLNYNPDADFNGDGAVDKVDWKIFRGLRGSPPGNPPGPSCCAS